MLITPLLQHLPLPLLPLLLFDGRLGRAALLDPHQLGQLPARFRDTLLLLGCRVRLDFVVVVVGVSRAGGRGVVAREVALGFEEGGEGEGA